jgi:sulfur relay (sulfurtransferase) DsrF/TusC family protein
MANQTQRGALRAILAASNAYDPDTMRISRDGVVSAQHDANKTMAGNVPGRFMVGYVDDLLNANKGS